MAAKHPIELQRLYTNPEKTGMFIIRAKALPADVQASMTEEELMARQKAEKRAVEAEWKKIDGHVDCPRCAGTGFKNNIRCIGCNGAGSVDMPQFLRLTDPKWSGQ